MPSFRIHDRFRIGLLAFIAFIEAVEEEDPPPALRFRPPVLPALRRFPSRELICARLQLLLHCCTAFLDFTIVFE
jgi:hypothetical protein